MDVRLPDGTIIRNVPDGMSKADLTAKLKANGYDLAQLEAPADAAPPQVPREDSLVNQAGRVARMMSPAGLVASLTSPQGRADAVNTAAGAVRGAGSIGATGMRVLPNALGGDTGPENDQRRTAMDAVLADMGADPQSVPFQISKTATEVGGTLPLGGVVAKPLAGVAPQLAQAITSGGANTGARVAPTAGAKAADLGIRMAGGGANAGISGALINPNDAAASAGVGTAIPLVTRVAGAAGHTVGRAVSSRMARSGAAEKVAGQLGDDVSQVVADMQTFYPKGASDIPVSAAAASGNPALARMEQGSRVQGAPAWYDLDQRQGKAVFDNVMSATREAGELGARKAARQENWSQAWAKAEESQRPRLWSQRMTQFGADLEQAMQSPQASNPEVRRVLEAINSEFDRLGPAFTPAHLQQLRANLNGKAQPLSPDVFKSAPRDSPAIRTLIGEMDDILNGSTGGRWAKVLQGYAKDSDAVRASAAASKVRGSFVDRDTGRTLGKSVDPNGDVPTITEAGLGRALNAARMPDGSLALSPAALGQLEATLEVLRRQGIVQGVKRTATAGGGSDTIPNAIAAGATQAGAPSMMMQILQGIRKLGMAKTDNEMARLLSDPDALAAALGAFQKPPQANAMASALARSAPALVADR